MIYAKVGDAAMVYTGDYNMTPDRHLGAAQIDRLNLDLVITEYGMCVFVCVLILFYVFVFYVAYPQSMSILTFWYLLIFTCDYFPLFRGTYLSDVYPLLW